MPRWLRILIWLVVIAAVVVLLFTVVFPRVERILEDPTMGAGVGILLATVSGSSTGTGGA
jgi:putative copper export protein